MTTKSGIYKIVNIRNGKIYIGSAVDLPYRWKLHKSRLNTGDHHNAHLQAAWNKNWGTGFEFHVVEYVLNQSKLIEREQYWIEQTKCYDKNIGYNKRVIAHSNFGTTRSDASKLKSSLAQKGRVFSEEHKQAMRGIKRSAETRKRMSESAKGRKLSKQAKEKVSDALRKRHAKKLAELTKNVIIAW